MPNLLFSVIVEYFLVYLKNFTSFFQILKYFSQLEKLQLLQIGSFK